MRKGSAHVVQGLMVDKDMKKFKDARKEGVVVSKWGLCDSTKFNFDNFF